ncbi:hypothetical protein D9757_007062 [Collybiopsis confluens]|uniref:Transcription factor CBF/NF-Y/archaeal histone domain-containing protein n=1 Tax=Collybiopsis confluens TaxID=2823264 RepID=A0A8H5HBX2_9AGAR|nr:hypothetical protein D9757_007062 [Collybiopsis confluens]
MATLSTEEVREEPPDAENIEQDLNEKQAHENIEEKPNANAPVTNAEGSEKKKKEKKDNVGLTREMGKSLLPFSRVQKIIKADKDIPIMARDATFLISLAAEEFIKRLCQAGHRVAEKEKRSTVQHKDLTAVVRRADEFMFLDEIISIVQPAPPQKRLPKALAANKTVSGGATIRDALMKAEADKHEVVMNEDGSMISAGD